ncbi:30S ribosomal protein S16 [Blattabacterium cuenoti]|uniref:30S ribosomal protein S16 n=1 Tax=Blattabacterium cuenoti TaxID=1653831 RepID=UPI00163BC3B4|nr:30S ribosomal protein S16 [Blattabacterium cuenoti]
MVKIRLRRVGKKHKPIYHIVIADSRFPRNGKFIEKLGIYNPHTNPSQIFIKIEKSISWIMKGAQPTKTVKSIFHKNGIWLKKYLLNGVKKGLLTKEKSLEKFNKWYKKNNNIINDIK